MSVATSSTRVRSHRGARSRVRSSGDTFEQATGYLVEALLAAVLILSPLAFGAVEFWAQWWVMLGVGTAILCVIVRWIAYPRTCRPTLTVAYIPIVLFLLLALLQWLPLPASAVAMLSPKTAATWKGVELLLPNETIHQTLSLYPLATERQLRLLILVSAVFALVINHVREREQIVRLLWAVLISGCLAGAVAISQNLGSESTWLGVTTTHADSGPFMNHSAFGQFMNLAAGGALALLLIGLKRQIGDRVMSFRSLKHHLYRKSSAALVIPLLFVLISPVLVALSLTRGGVLSIVISGAITGVLLGFTHSGRGKRTLIAVIGFLVLLVMLKFGFDRIYDRMATLRNVHETGGGVRLQMVRDMTSMAREFPVVGIGLGAFSHVFPSYDTAAVREFATHAENEYAQLAVETGLAGVALISAFLLIVLFHAFNAVRHGRRSIHAGSVGLIFGLIAILIHSASDFGQHVPAIACLTATVTALIVRLGIDARADLKALDETAAIQMSSAGRIASIGVAVVLLGALIWAIGRTSAESDAEAAWMTAKRNYIEMERRGLTDASDGEFIQSLTDMSKAVDLVPGDADYRYGLNAMRWQSIGRYDRSLTRDFLVKISQECLNVSSIAPYFGPSLTFAGQIRTFDLGDPSGIPLIRRGYTLARYSREASYAVAMLDARDGKWDECLANLQHSIELGTSRAEAARLLAIQFKRVDLALDLVKGHRPDMVAFAQVLERAGDDENARALLDSATELLVSEANRTDAPVDALVQLADAYIRDGQHANAVPLLRRALVVRYDRTDWRTLLVQCLVEAGERDQALSEARINYRLNPGDANAKQLIEDLMSDPKKVRTSIQ